MSVDIRTVVLALLGGMFVGAFFAVTRLPMPAPPKLAGVAGIVGIYLGYRLLEVLV